jgi:hypothetical protein
MELHQNGSSSFALTTLKKHKLGTIRRSIKRSTRFVRNQLSHARLSLRVCKKTPSNETIRNKAASVGGLFILKLASRQGRLLAQSRHLWLHRACPLSGVKRTINYCNANVGKAELEIAPQNVNFSPKPNTTVIRPLPRGV